MKTANGHELAQLFEKIAPRKLAVDDDNIGWQIGGRNRQVAKVMITLDVTEAVVQEAIDQKIDLIYAHHPLLYRPLKQIVPENLQGRIVEMLIVNQISLFVAHTNLDAATGGVNDLLAAALRLEQVKNLDVHFADEHTGESFGIGKIGYLPERVPLKTFALQVKHTYSLGHVRVVGAPGKMIRKVAIVGGSGSSYISKAKYQGADCLVTGDISYHYAVDAEQEGICLIDAGHTIETIMKQGVCESLQTLVKGRFEVEVMVSQIETDPFTVL